MNHEKNAMTHEDLVTTLRSLFLHSMAREYVEIARLAEKGKSTYEQYLFTLAVTEFTHRKEQRVKRLIKGANFPLQKTLDAYQFPIRQGINQQQIARLMQGDWVRQGSNVVFYGGFGMGKTHLAIGIGRALCGIGLRVFFTTVHELIQKLLDAKKALILASTLKRLDRFDLIVCDELGYLSQTQEGAELFFQLISQRAERKSLLITTNLTYSEWDKVFLNPLSTAAAVDRIIHLCETFNISGKISFRAEEAEKAASKRLTDTVSAST
jgi:DNA replication protein DnaC